MVTKEEDNFLRVVYLNYRVGTTALRRYFDSVHPFLPADLSSPPNKAILASLHKPPRGQRRVLYQEQWDILYPPTGAPVVSSAKLDVTLMVCLLRNLPPMVPPPTPNGFDALPQHSDSSIGAHIARIKYYKNFIVSHSKDGKLSDADFNTIWIDMDIAINGLGNQQDITDAADAKTKVLDFKAIMEHLNIEMGIKRNRKRYVEQSGKIVEHASKIAKLETTIENLDLGKVEQSSADNASKIAILETTVEYIEQGDFMEFLKDKLIHSTILDKEVLDNLITKCVLTLDDREEIINCNNQLSRNKKLLKILNHRPYNTLGGLVEAMKESDQRSHFTAFQNGGQGRRQCYDIAKCTTHRWRISYFQQWVKEKNITGKDPKVLEIIEDLIEVCDIEENITGRKLKNQIDILIGTFVTGILRENRLVKCGKFQTALNSYLKQINVASIIQTGSSDFLNTMFVITENGSQDMSQKQNERFGIDIPEDLLQDYIARWFDDLTKHVGRMIVRSSHVMSYLHSGQHKALMLDEFMNENRPLTNPAFRIALRTYMRQLTTVKIASLIHTAEDAFLNTMFVMTENDINDKAESRYEWFGIVIPDEILQQYIEKYFDRLTNEYSVVTDIHKNRALKNIKVHTALRTHMKQLTREEIALLIQNSVHIFFNTMFVMTENDIKNSAQSQFACFGIVIPDDLVQQYIQRWFDELTKTHTVEAAISQNRPLVSDKFLSSVRTYLRQLTIENIALIIQTTQADFIDKLFVMTEADNRDNAENRYECFGIVIPDELLQPYIEKWLNYLIKTSFEVSAISENRPLINVKFRRAVRTHMKQLTTKTSLQSFRYHMRILSIQCLSCQTMTSKTTLRTDMNVLVSLFLMIYYSNTFSDGLMI
ncbi:unnamed protein product [Mytilus edulis]|uniref:CARD domain-containing protein n=1 Tax=Mytilus edulis TaxID=6550 RepID=A0A8S3QZA9_MYTED|nr:unnamed protein product [Mytilus edulis]